MRQAFGAGMGAVGGGKSVVHVKIAGRRQFGDERRIIGFLAGMEARVLQNRDATRRQRAGSRRHACANAIRHKRHRPAQNGSKCQRNRLQAVLLVAPLGSAEVREHQHLGPSIGQRRDGRHSGTQAGVITHMAIGHRHVQVGADQHGLAGQRRHIIYGAERSHCS